MVTTLAKEDRHNKNRAIDKRRGWVSLVTIIIKFCEKEETDKKLPLGAVFYLLRSGYRETISLQIGFPIEENFCS